MAKDGAERAGKRRGRPLLPADQVRDRSAPLLVYVTAAEREVIEDAARRAGVSVSALLRAVGTNAQVRSVVDPQATASLIRLEARLDDLAGKVAEAGGTLAPGLADQLHQAAAEVAGRLADL
ncbi:plasmid mobilization protein [Falsiroseomonas sp.]|uniref:plasmid mobilization protein n=1 Tax=Falsiroseomonas sp. TaxID=2870721 RepID=UPI003F6FDCA9